MPLPFYFEQEIATAQLWGKEAISEPNASNVKEWRERIEYDMSPENLTCDGELPSHMVSARLFVLREALEYLKQFD